MRHDYLFELQIKSKRMNKFKPIQTHQPSKRYIINGAKVLRLSERINFSQLPKTTSMRSLRLSPPLPAFSTLLDISKKPPLYSTQRHRVGIPSPNYVFKQKMGKNFLGRSKRFNTEERESIYERHVESLKNYINDIAFKQEPLKKDELGGRQQLSDACLAGERKKFLMGQVSFTHIDEQRVMAQKKYLERFQYLSKSVPRKMRESASGENSNGNESRVFQCLRCIDRVYGLLREMQEVGYPLKTNRYVIHYCSVGRLWLKQVFLHESDEKRDAFTIAVKYLVNHNPEDSKARFAEFAGKTRGEELRVAQDDLEGLYMHLQQSLAQKKVSQVSNVASYIEGRLHEDGKAISRSLRLTTAPPDKMKLTADLNGIQEKFGAMRNITKISRRRYDELNRTYDKLQTLV